MLYKNLVAGIPKGAIVMADRKVFWTIEKKYLQDKRYNHDKRKLIGKTLEASRSQMYPNDNYGLAPSSPFTPRPHI